MLLQAGVPTLDFGGLRRGSLEGSFTRVVNKNHDELGDSCFSLRAP